eukprot:351352-Chlamydomonas_euryale.AAC.8
MCIRDSAHAAFSHGAEAPHVQHVHPGDSTHGRGAIGSKEAAELLSGCMDDLRALRKLQNHAAKLGAAECAAQTRVLLAAVGATVDAAVPAARAGALWDAVARAAKSAMSGERLMAVYAKIKAAKQAKAAAKAAVAAVPGSTSDGSGTLLPPPPPPLGVRQHR